MEPEAPFPTLKLKDIYRSTVDDTLSEFYIPVINSASTYDRAVGYFSSAVLELVGEPVIAFAIRGGQMRLICSPALSPEDVDAISGSDSLATDLLDLSLKRALQDLLSLQRDGAFAVTLLATLLAKRVLSLKVCVPRRHLGLYHEKLGILCDSDGNRIVFHGSCNESFSAWSRNGESFDVFKSWDGAADLRRIENHIEYFGQLWRDAIPEWQVVEIPETTHVWLRQYAQDSLLQLEDEFRTKREPNRTKHSTRETNSLKLRMHQLEAISAWTNNTYRGILEHATGSGKTITALAILRQFLTASVRNTAMVIVPSVILLKQWLSTMEALVNAGFLPRLDILQAGGGNLAWQIPGRVADHTRSDPDFGRVILATLPTASNVRFLSQVRDGTHLCVIVDEVHTAGSPHYRSIFQLRCGAALGLSATPTRYHDESGTGAIFDFFGSIIHRYSLGEAISDGYLLPYVYSPQFVSLNTDEEETYNALSKRIALCWGGEASPSDQAKDLLIARARIVKKAASKIGSAVNFLEQQYKIGDRWLVYCEDTDQLDSLNAAIDAAHLDCEVRRFISNMDDDADQSIAGFVHHGGILLSIRCLEAGVDIPEISHAIIIASSRNPREFIQRRGRVLRRHPVLTRAFIADILVLPAQIDVAGPQSSLAVRELERASLFAEMAYNAEAAGAIIRSHLARLETSAEPWMGLEFPIDVVNEEDVSVSD